MYYVSVFPTQFFTTIIDIFLCIILPSKNLRHDKKKNIYIYYFRGDLSTPNRSRWIVRDPFRPKYEYCNVNSKSDEFRPLFILVILQNFKGRI